MSMDKYATDPGSRSEHACEEAYAPKPGTNTPLEQATCGNCAQYDSVRNTRGALCPYSNRPRPINKRSTF